MVVVFWEGERKRCHHHGSKEWFGFSSILVIGCAAEGEGVILVSI